MKKKSLSKNFLKNNVKPNSKTAAKVRQINDKKCHPLPLTIINCEQM
jgi:hypothetical protein